MSMKLAPAADLAGLYHQLNSIYGRQAWWPAQGRFEILVGAVLTQNTAWSNVERAIENLRESDCLEAGPILAADEDALVQALKPCGTFRIKTRRLKNLCTWFDQAGGFAELDRQPTDILRRQLLAIQGIGPETADAILLYAFGRPVFVVDAYTKRLLIRLGWLARDGERGPGYEPLRAVFELTLPTDADMFAQYHALIVEHAKQRCRARPQCGECMLRNQCNTGRINT